MMSQDVLAAKSQQLHQIVDDLVAIVTNAVQRHVPIHEVEHQAFKRLLEAGRTTVQLLVDCLGDGDVGQEHRLPDGTTLKRSEAPQPRPYVSIYGDLDIRRYVYAEREGQAVRFAAVDARLALPEGKFSYLLQDWDQNFAVEQPFGTVCQTVEKILGLEQHVDSVERMNREMAKAAEAFRSAQATPPAAEEGEIFVQTADGKGIPIRRPADAPPIVDHRHQRGPKPDRKKMATVGAVYSIDRHRRTAEEVVESLFRDPRQGPSTDPLQPKTPRPSPCHKRMQAMLDHIDVNGDPIDGRVAIFGWISDEMAARRGRSAKPIVCIMDGEQSLWKMRDVFQDDVPMIDILDLLHVTPRLWDAAHLFHPSGGRPAERFVRQRVLQILQGRVGAVVRGLRRMGTTHKLRGHKRTVLATICGYFERNRHRMRYREYLAQGYPIASGVIEGACRHIIKDRLERTGMNWTVPGAQAMLDLRCIYLMGEWEQFTEFRVARETKRLYPYRDALKRLRWFVAA